MTRPVSVTKFLFTELFHERESLFRSSLLFRQSKNSQRSWDQKIHYLVHKCLPLVLVIRLISNLFIDYVRSTLILSSNLRLDLRSGIFLSDFTSKFCTHFCLFVFTQYTKLIISLILNRSGYFIQHFVFEHL
jgi:hypothetical protein